MLFRSRSQKHSDVERNLTLIALVRYVFEFRLAAPRPHMNLAATELRPFYDRQNHARTMDISRPPKILHRSGVHGLCRGGVHSARPPRLASTSRRNLRCVGFGGLCANNLDPTGHARSGWCAQRLGGWTTRPTGNCEIRREPTKTRLQRIGAYGLGPYCIP